MQNLNPNQNIRIKNLTPHIINILTETGEIWRALVPELVGAWVEEAPGARYWAAGWPCPIREPSVYGKVMNLPDPEEGVWLVVSLPVLEALRKAGSTRKDVFGVSWLEQDMVRFKEGPNKGQPYGTRALVML